MQVIVIFAIKTQINDKLIIKNANHRQIFYKKKQVIKMFTNKNPGYRNSYQQICYKKIEVIKKFIIRN